LEFKLLFILLLIFISKTIGLWENPLFEVSGELAAPEDPEARKT